MILLDGHGVAHRVSSFGFNGSAWVKAACGFDKELTGTPADVVTCLSCTTTEWFTWSATMSFSLGVDHASQEE